MVAYSGDARGARCGPEKAGFAAEVAAAFRAGGPGGQPLAGRRAPRHPMQVTGGPELPYDPPVIELGRSGPSQDRVFTRPSADYPDDTDIWFERGNQSTVVRVTPADRARLTAALAALAGLHDRAAALGGPAVVLAGDAVAAGYKRCMDDRAACTAGRSATRWAPT